MQKKSVIAIALCCVVASCQQLNGAAENPNGRQYRAPAGTYFSRLLGVAQTATGVAGDLSESVAYLAQKTTVGVVSGIVKGTCEQISRVQNALTLTPEEHKAHASVQSTLQEYRELPHVIIGCNNEEPGFIKGSEFPEEDDEKSGIN